MTKPSYAHGNQNRCFKVMPLCVVVKLACYIITNEDPTSTGDSEPWGIRQFASTGFEAVAAGATNAHAAR